MALKLILTLGLPASGKTTWAREYIAGHNDTVNLCKDDLRLQLPNSKKREKYVLQVRDLLTEHYLSLGFSVIWSDTNLNPIHKARAEDLAKKYEAKVVMQDFTHVSMEECIERDLKRLNSVGARVIQQMYYDYLFKPEVLPLVQVDRPSCYLVDVDGTLALNTSKRNFFAWDRVGEDSPNAPVVQMVQTLAQQAEIIVLSGRSRVCEKLTADWLDRYGVPFKALYMRASDDQRPDELVKSELYDAFIRDRFNVLGVIDDRPKVCRMWRGLGLPVFQVGNPDYEF
jgi:predicted kinase